MTAVGTQMVSPLFLFQRKARYITGECQFTRSRVALKEEELDALERLHHGLVPTNSDYLEKWREAHLMFESLHAFTRFICDELERQQRGFPLVYEIELTNHCPYRCVMCPRTTDMTRPLGHMGMELYCSIIDEIAPHQRFITLHHFGESLLYPRLAEAIRYAYDKQVMADLSVNPPTLSPDRIDQLLDSGLSTLTVSLDSLDPNVYQRIRGVRVNMDRVRRNLDYLISARDRRGSTPIITLQMINLKANKMEQQRFIDHWRDYGFDAVIVRQFSSRDYSIDKSFALSDEAFGVRRICKAPWKQLTVLWDGRVVPCSLDYNGDIVLGKVGPDTLATIWRSPRIHHLRKEWQHHDLCNRCTRSPFHMLRVRERLGFRRFHFQDANYQHHLAAYSAGYHGRLYALGYF